MNMSNEERFFELAHKALSKKAQPSEEAELRALLTASPKLKNDFEQMGAEAAAAREMLPLLEDIERPREPVPPAPMARLRREVREVFSQGEQGRAGMRDLVGQLERWIRRDPAPATREEGTTLVHALQKLLLGGAVVGEEMVCLSARPALPSSGAMAADLALMTVPRPSPATTAAVPSSARHDPRKESGKPETELLEGLDRMERRLSEAVEQLQRSGMEAEKLLEAIRRERKILQEMSAKKGD